MTAATRTPVALHVETDLGRGGRWTSLRTDGKEWLWARNEPRRADVSVRDPFADAGGLEECVPTVRGIPDHGDVWSRTWYRDHGAEVVDADGFRLHRTIDNDDGVVIAGYRLEAAPGYRFLWAAHALLDLSVRGRIVLPPGTETRLYDEARPFVAPGWDAGARWITGSWPEPAGFRMDTTGAEDGTAVGASAGPWRDDAEVEVCDGSDILRMELHAPGQPVSIALWRNLGGFPAEDPYRSIGVEPMVGMGFDLDDCAGDEAATVPDTGVVEWRLIMRAFHEAS